MLQIVFSLKFNFVFCQQVGSDSFGKDIISNFENWGVDTQYVSIKSIDTGVAQINVTDNGENMLILNCFFFLYYYSIKTHTEIGNCFTRN